MGVAQATLGSGRGGQHTYRCSCEIGSTHKLVHNPLAKWGVCLSFSLHSSWGPASLTPDRTGF